MKATDLMIGDWVGVFDDEGIIKDCRQVDWIRTGEIGMRYHKVWSIGCIEPIPLTAEILEKNGWWYEIEDMWLHDEVSFCIEKWNGKFQCYDINQIKLDSVHQLQHALRLCGLDELADNFKV